MNENTEESWKSKQNVPEVLGNINLKKNLFCATEFYSQTFMTTHVLIDRR